MIALVSFSLLSCVLCSVFYASFGIAVKPIRHFSCSGFCEVITVYVVGLVFDPCLCIIMLDLRAQYDVLVDYHVFSLAPNAAIGTVNTAEAPAPKATGLL